jgi:[acyl-carrier-protein] S-malonyltransferase
MQAASNLERSGMASVLGLETDQVHAVCDTARKEGEVLQVANLLCPGNIAVSGHLASLEAAEHAAATAGAMKFIRLSVAGAFHTRLMESAVEPLANAISSATLSDASVPVYCNVDAQPHSSASEFAPLLSRQVISPVLWEQTLRNLLAIGIDQFYELGSGRVLAGTLKRIERKIACESIGE